MKKGNGLYLLTLDQDNSGPGKKYILSTRKLHAEQTAAEAEPEARRPPDTPHWPCLGGQGHRKVSGAAVQG